MARSSKSGRKKVTFTFNAVDASEVYVAGTFNDWEPRKKLMKKEDGIYSATVLLDKGKHEYKFVVDGVWCIDPECEDWTPNEYGSLDSVIVVS